MYRQVGKNRDLPGAPAWGTGARPSSREQRSRFARGRDPVRHLNWSNLNSQPGRRIAGFNQSKAG
ncbi:hypothetical protein BGLA2_420075 [Burkholderia gladioli]|nr:hypothetical protein BGLA2_420075 [Burkholderia gladioli]